MKSRSKLCSTGCRLPEIVEYVVFQAGGLLMDLGSILSTETCLCDRSLSVSACLISGNSEKERSLGVCPLLPSDKEANRTTETHVWPTPRILLPYPLTHFCLAVNLPGATRSGISPWIATTIAVKTSCKIIQSPFTARISHQASHPLRRLPG